LAVTPSQFYTADHACHRLKVEMHRWRSVLG
jgi:hypothetical protein